MKTFHVFFHGYCVAMFLFFSVLQYNDIDSGLWILHYSLAALISLLELLKPKGYRIRTLLIACGSAAYVAVFAFHVPLDSAAWRTSSSVVALEDGREALGALICLAALTITWVKGHRFGLASRVASAKGAELSEEQRSEGFLHAAKGSPIK